MTRNGKGYYVAMTENHTKSGNIGNYSELDDHQVSTSGIKITPGCNTYIYDLIILCVVSILYVYIYVYYSCTGVHVYVLLCASLFIF